MWEASRNVGDVCVMCGGEALCVAYIGVLASIGGGTAYQSNNSLHTAGVIYTNAMVAQSSESWRRRR